MSSAARKADLPLRPYAVSRSTALDTEKHPGAEVPSGYDPLLVLRAGAEPLQPVVAPLQLVRRRASIVQGRALESLGHAVEYLVDSRMFLLEDHNRVAESEAVQVLMRASRQVFLECREVVSPWVKLERLVNRCLG